MCHTERYFVKKAIYVNLPGSPRITYRFCDVSYRAMVACGILTSFRVRVVLLRSKQAC